MEVRQCLGAEKLHVLHEQSQLAGWSSAFRTRFVVNPLCVSVSSLENKQYLPSQSEEQTCFKCFSISSSVNGDNEASELLSFEIFECKDPPNFSYIAIMECVCVRARACVCVCMCACMCACTCTKHRINYPLISLCCHTAHENILGYLSLKVRKLSSKEWR